MIERVTKAVIPAAGLGTRFLPITKAVPKPMLSVLDKPTIQYIAEELVSVGIKDIVIVVSPGSEVIGKHFGPAEELEERLLSDGKKKLYDIERQTQRFNVKFVVQKVANGLAGAILCAEKYVKKEPFALLLGDELMYTPKGKEPCMKRLMDVYLKTGKSVLATMEVFGDDISKYGNLGVGKDIEGAMEVTEIKEKPSVNEALSNYALVGRYVLTGDVMGMLKKLPTRRHEIELTDALDELAKKGKLLAAPFEDVRYDVGDKFGYIRANVEFALRSKEIGRQTKEYIKELAQKL